MRYFFLPPRDVRVRTDLSAPLAALPAARAAVPALFAAVPAERLACLESFFAAFFLRVAAAFLAASRLLALVCAMVSSSPSLGWWN